MAKCEKAERSSLAKLERSSAASVFAVVTGLWRAYEKDLAYPSETVAPRISMGSSCEKLTETLDMLEKRAPSASS